MSGVEIDKERLVEDVLDKILQIIPISETKLIYDLNNYKNSLHNKAPEIRRTPDCWIPFINILNYHISEIKETWQIEIRNVLTKT